MINNISLDHVINVEHKNYLAYVLMCLCAYNLYMCISAMYCVCMHHFHSAYISKLYNSVKCVHFLK